MRLSRAKEQPMRIEAEDILKSRVFDEGDPAGAWEAPEDEEGTAAPARPR